MKRFLSVLIMPVLLLCSLFPLSSAYQTTSYRMSEEHLELYTCSDGSYLINRTGGQCHIEKLCPNTYGADLQLNHTIAAVSIFHDTVVALCNDVDNNQLIVSTYRADTDVLESFAIHNVRYYGDSGFYYNKSGVYLVSNCDSRLIEHYSPAGKLLDSYSFNSTVNQLGADYRGNIFAVSKSTLYRMNSNRFTALGGAEISVPVSFFANDYFSDASARIIRITADSCRLIMKADSAYGKKAACLIDNILYYPFGNQIFGYDINTGEKQYSFELSNSISGLYSYKGDVCALTDSTTPTISRIRTNEFTDIRPKVDPTSYNSDANRPGNNSNQSNQTPSNGMITSDVYDIDYQSYSISSIPSGTTLAAFKRNVSFEGYSVRFYRDGIQKTDGKCGTAMTAVFSSDNCEYTFELSVIGDITGEGSVNSRDLKLLMEYLLGTADFNGVYLISADLSCDGQIDVKDLALMHRMY